jgi:hypothetical protein
VRSMSLVWLGVHSVWFEELIFGVRWCGLDEGIRDAVGLWSFRLGTQCMHGVIRR